MEMIEPHLNSAMASFDHNLIFAYHWNAKVDEFEYEFDCYTIVLELKKM